MIRLSRPTIGDEEVRAAEKVLRSGMLVAGAEVARFEEAAAVWCGRRHAIAVSSGTSALHLALVALGVGDGDEVLCPDLTWPSPAHAIALTGATPVLVDVDLDEWNVRGEALAAARTERTRAAIAIDQFGNPLRRAEIVAALPGVAVIEDAACAIGSRFADGSPCGSLGTIACLSFHPRKVVTTGEGGMCLTDDDAIADRLRVLRNHGQAAPGRFVEPAGNQRLGEVAAAVGTVQLARLEAMIARRDDIAARYREALPELAFQRAPEGAAPNHQTMGALLPPGTSAAARDAVVTSIRARGVEAGILSYALHRLASLKSARRAGSVENAEAIVDRGVAIPMHAELTADEQKAVIDAVRAAIGEHAP